MIRLICVGKIKESWIKEGINEFTKRLNAFTKLEVIEIKDSTPEKEAAEIERRIKPGLVYLLDEKGNEYDSYQFSELIKKSSFEKDIAFVIGGPNGFSLDFKLKHRSIALSKMTFTHEMARLFFIEQLYRAFMIMNNRNYHK